MNRKLRPTSPFGWMTAVILTMILLLLATSIVLGDELRIVGPERVEVANEARLLVDGLATPPVDSNMADLQAWATRLVVTVDGPPEAQPITDAELSLALGSGLRLRIFLTPDKPGIYVLVLVDPTDPAGVAVATHRLTAGGTIPPDPTPGPAPVPGPNPYPAPSQSIQQATATIRSLALSREHATTLATLYQDAARLVESAPAAIAAGTKPEIASTSDLRQWLISNGRELGLQGQYAGLADAVDRFLGQSLGATIRNVTEADAQVLRGLAWAVWEAGR